MADHLRKRIRSALTTAVTGLSTTGARVYQTRVYPTESQNLPCLLVEQGDESAQPMTLGGSRVFERSSRVRVIALAEGNSSLDNTLDEICRQVEVALAHPCSALSGLAKYITLLGTEFEYVGGGEKPFGQATMTFEVVYMAVEKTPDVAA